MWYKQIHGVELQSKKLACFTAWMLCNSLKLPASDCICPSKLTSWTSLAETLHLACIFILGISELIFLVQQRDLKEAVSEKFQIPEQICESDWSERERNQVWKRLIVITQYLFYSFPFAVENSMFFNFNFLTPKTFCIGVQSINIVELLKQSP